MADLTAGSRPSRSVVAPRSTANRGRHSDEIAAPIDISRPAIRPRRQLAVSSADLKELLSDFQIDSDSSPERPDNRPEHSENFDLLHTHIGSQDVKRYSPDIAGRKRDNVGIRSATTTRTSAQPGNRPQRHPPSRENKERSSSEDVVSENPRHTTSDFQSPVRCQRNTSSEGPRPPNPTLGPDAESDSSPCLRHGHRVFFTSHRDDIDRGIRKLRPITSTCDIDSSVSSSTVSTGNVARVLPQSDSFLALPSAIIPYLNLSRLPSNGEGVSMEPRLQRNRENLPQRVSREGRQEAQSPQDGSTHCTSDRGTARSAGRSNGGSSSGSSGRAINGSACSAFQTPNGSTGEIREEGSTQVPIVPRGNTGQDECNEELHNRAAKAARWKTWQQRSGNNSPSEPAATRTVRQPRVGQVTRRGPTVVNTDAMPSIRNPSVQHTTRTDQRSAQRSSHR